MAFRARWELVRGQGHRLERRGRDGDPQVHRLRRALERGEEGLGLRDLRQAVERGEDPRKHAGAVEGEAVPPQPGRHVAGPADPRQAQAPRSHRVSFPTWRPTLCACVSPAYA